MGTPEQQQRYLPVIVDGTTPWCQLFGTDGRLDRTARHPRGEGWR